MSRILLISALSAAMAVQMFGQVAGRLTGSVVDPSGASVADASVNLFLPGGKSPVLSTHTTSEGNFDFSAVRPDTYRLEVQAKGFGDYAQGGVAVDPARQTSLPPIHLQLQTTTQLVEVTASANTIDTNTIEVSNTVTQEQVMNLPVLDRQINNLFYTQPGVNFNGSADTVINGLRAQNTNVTLDGVNIQDNFIRINGLDFLPNKLTIGEVSELTVSTSNLSPTIGGNANAITLSTPSGTNVYHGSVYWYNRNNFFSSNDWFNNRDGVAKPFLNLNQFGGTIGGPIKKDKLLFYAAYETYDLHQTTPTTTTILSPLARQGILQYRTNGTGAIQQFNVLQNPGATPAPLKIDPFISNLLASVPTAGNSTSVGDGLNTLGYAFNARSNERRDSVIGKLDYNLSPSHVFSGTFRWNRDNVDRPDIGSFYTAVPPVSNQDNAKFFSANWRWSPTATLTNEVRGGGNLTVNPFVVAGTLPSFFVTGAIMTNPVNTFLPQGRDTNTYNLQDNANWIHGKHSVSFGFQTQQARVAAFNSAGIVPSYTLGVFSANDPYGYGTGDIPGATATDTGTGNALLGTLAGLIQAATQSYNVTNQTSGFVPGAPSKQNMSFNDYALYATDSWKITHRLTAVLGVRWDYFPPVAEVNNLLIQPQLINNNPVQTLLGNASLTFQGNHLYNSDWNNFAPHVGLAYDPFGKGKTVIRGGYTISYAQDDMLEAALNTATANSGLTGASSILNTFAFTSAPPKLTTPAFQIPISTQQNFVNTGGNNVQGLIDPNLRTPYVQQWNLSVQHEWKGMVFEGAYIGNHAVKLVRQIDFNQINVNQSSFVQDFKNARNNGLLALASASKVFNPAYNPAIPGSVPLPFFNSLTSAGGLTNTTVRTDILSNQIGALAQFYQQANVFPTNISGFSYFPNPLTLYSSELTNYSNSSYNGLQTQVRRRARNGMQFQVSYVFSKALSDTSVERGLDAILDNNNPSIERARAPWDLTHSFKVNHYIPIPLGKGHRYNYAPLDWLIGDWAISGFITVNSGAPISILSARGTLNRTARSGQNTVDTTDTLSQLQGITGMFMTGNGPYFVNPSAIGPNGTGAAADGSAPFAGQVFFNPGAATVGSLQRRLLSGPWYDNYNFEVQKKFQFTERQSIQLKADFYNLFNHPNFFAGDQNINSVNFGKITSMFTSAEGVSARVMQFGLFYRF